MEKSFVPLSGADSPVIPEKPVEEPTEEVKPEPVQIPVLPLIY